MKKSIRLLSLLLALLTVLVMAVACTEKSDDDDDEKESAGENKDDGENKDNGENKDDGSPTTIEETVLVDDGTLKITATEYNIDKYLGDSIKVLVENNGADNLTVSLETLIVNDFIIPNSFFEEVGAGKKVNTTIDLNSYNLEPAGITKVGKVECYFKSHIVDDYSNITPYPVATINTSKLDSMDGTAGEGKEIYNKDGIRILAKYVENQTLNEKDISLYIENNTSANYRIACDNLSINGFMVDEYLSALVLAGKKTIASFNIFSEDLENNGITSFEEVELKFNFMDPETYMTAFESDVITFTFE